MRSEPTRGVEKVLEGFDLKTCPVCNSNYACRECPRCGSGKPKSAFIAPSDAPKAPVSTMAETEFEAFDGLERDLQAGIEDFLEQEGLYYWHDRSRGKNERGLPDLVIAAWGGKTLWWELKRKGKTLRKEQRETRIKLLALGHEFEVIRSLEQARAIIRRKKEERKQLTERISA